MTETRSLREATESRPQQDGPARPAVSIALYQPDIAGNTGTVMRLGACLDLEIHIIEPAGFDLSDRALTRAGMDYLELSTLTRHVDFAAFEATRHRLHRRLILFTTKGSSRYTDFAFKQNDILLFGRESAGVPEEIHECADARVTIPMDGGGRSLNLAVSVGMAAGESLRQLRWARGTTPLQESV